MSRYRILLVDDHALLREGLAGIISSQRCRETPAIHGADLGEAVLDH